MAIRIIIDLDEKGAVRGIKSVDRELTKLEKTGKVTRDGIKKTNEAIKKKGKETDKTSRSLKKMNKIMLTQAKSILPPLLVGYAAFKALGLARHTLGIAGSFEVLQISLDTITKGKGPETFERLNKWALKMPVSTQSAIKSFQMMSAMGLKPAIKDMTTLVDTASALGGQQGTLEGIARALGQIVTKGKVSAEELMQLAERGIPAYQILQEEMGLTASELGNIGNMAIDGQKAVDALLTGMNKRFAGQSEKIRNTYQGINTEIKSNWQEWIRLVMDTGPFEKVKSIMIEIRDITEGMVDDQELLAKRAAATLSLTAQGATKEGFSFTQKGGMVAGVTERGGAFSAEQISDEIDRMERIRDKAIRALDVNLGPDFKARIHKGGALKMRLPDEDKNGQPKITKERLKLVNAYFDRMKAIAKLNSLRYSIGAAGVGRFETGAAGVGRFETESADKFGRTKGLLGDTRKSAFTGPSPEEIKKQLEKIEAIRRDIDENAVSLAKDRNTAQIALLKKRFQAEFGMLKEHNELRLVAEERLSQDIALIQEQRAQDVRDRIQRLAVFMERAFGQMSSKISVDSVVDSLKSTAISVGQRALFSGIAAALIPGGAGFLAGATGSLESTGILGRSAVPFSSDSGADRIVAQLKRSAIGSNVTHINNTFSPRERGEMSGMTDEQFAAQQNRVRGDRRV